MGRAYDFAYRPTLGDPDPSDGGGCDDRPHRVELLSAGSDRAGPNAVWGSFSVCPEHEMQLRRYDDRLRGRGTGPRFRNEPSASASDGR